jgi:hypothetical protein
VARNGRKNGGTKAGSPRCRGGAGKKLAEDFLSDLERLWQQHGREALCRLATERPLAFFRMMIKLAQVHPLELGPPEERAWPCNREEVLQRLETRGASSCFGPPRKV